MAHYKFDLVQETSTSTGTGALTLAGAVTRRRAFSAVLSNADTCYVLIESASAAEWEICLATYNSGGNTLSRGAVLASSTGSAVSFSAGTKTISLVPVASKMVVMDNNGDASVTRDLAVTRNAAITGTLNVTGVGTFAGAVTITDNLSFPIGNARKVGQTASSTHAAGNVGSMFYGIDDGGGFAGVKVNNTHDGTYSSQDIEFWTAQGGSVATTLRAKVLKSGQLYGYQSISSLGADASFSGGGNRAMMDMASGVARVGGIDGGGAATQCALYAANAEYIRIGAAAVILKPSGTERVACIDGYLYSWVDNYMNLGSGANRWNTVYCTTGTINTSGRDSKLFVGEALEAEKRAAATIKAKPRRYKMKDSVDQKGEARARWHFGYVAEDVRDALEAEGLDPWAYAFLCADAIPKIETYFEKATRPKVRKVPGTESAVEIIDGKPVMVAKQIERDKPVGTMVAVLDEAGEPVMVKTGEEPTGDVVPVLDEGGEPVMVPAIVERDGKLEAIMVPATRPVMRDVMAPLLHLVQETEEYEEERTREVDSGEVRLGLRYSELEAFLRSAD